MFFRKHTPYWYLLPPGLFMLAFFFVPLFLAFQISLMDYSHDLYTPSFTGFRNYQTLLHTAPFWNALKNTFLFLVCIVPAMITLPIPFALLVNGKLKGLALFRSIIYIPVVTSIVVVGLTWRWMYADDGLVNWLLSLLHLPKVGWLVNPDVALYSVAIVIVWKGLAYYMMMYLAHLQGISHELYEAAEIDGANPWQKHWHVTLPHLRPTMVMVGLISTIGCLKIFGEVYVMTGGGPVGATQTLVYYIYERAFANLDLGLASAAGIVLMLILLAISILEIRLSHQEEFKKLLPLKPKSPTASPQANVPLNQTGGL